MTYEISIDSWTNLKHYWLEWFSLEKETDLIDSVATELAKTFSEKYDKKMRNSTKQSLKVWLHKAKADVVGLKPKLQKKNKIFP